MANDYRTEDERIKSIRTLLNAPIEQTAPDNHAQGWRRDCDYLLTEFDEKCALLIECSPHLRSLARQCEACEGAGEIVTGPSDEEATSEPCTHCKPIWDLIERMETPAPPPQPAQHREQLRQEREATPSSNERATFIELLNLAEHFLAERQSEADETALRKRIAEALTKAPPDETSAPLTHSPEPSAYLKLWDQNGPRCRVDLTPINEPWLEYLKPIVTPLYARMPSVEPTPERLPQSTWTCEHCARVNDTDTTFNRCPFCDEFRKGYAEKPSGTARRREPLSAGLVECKSTPEKASAPLDREAVNALALQCAQASAVVRNREWNFDRYRNGKLKAQGVTVHAATEAEAWEKARSLLYIDGNMPTDELRLQPLNGDALP